MNNSIIAYNPCCKCEKDKCNICELNMYRQGTIKKDKWISVEERLPEENERVLVALTSGRSYTVIDTDRISSKYIYKWVRWGNEVTHWMPLPQPPKMKGAE